MYSILTVEKYFEDGIPSSYNQGLEATAHVIGFQAIFTASTSFHVDGVLQTGLFNLQDAIDAVPLEAERMKSYI
jgi:hypothetical protein